MYSFIHLCCLEHLVGEGGTVTKMTSSVISVKQKNCGRFSCSNNSKDKLCVMVQSTSSHQRLPNQWEQKSRGPTPNTHMPLFHSHGCGVLQTCQIKPRRRCGEWKSCFQVRLSGKLFYLNEQTQWVKEVCDKRQCLRSHLYFISIRTSLSN